MSGRASVAELSPGQRVGDFEIVRLLGTGGSSRVYLARQRSLDRLVALKVAAAGGDEGRTLAALDHPHIVPVFAEEIVDGRRLMAMRYLPGISLAELLARIADEDRRFLTGAAIGQAIAAFAVQSGEEPGSRETSPAVWPAAESWTAGCGRSVAHVAEALRHAHQRDVLHCDVKPENILLSADGRALLMDFNVARVGKGDATFLGAAPSGPSRQQSRVPFFVGGTPAFMAPEQLSALAGAAAGGGGMIDARTDLFSLGVVFFQLLTGRHPFLVVSGSTPAAAREMLADRLRGSAAWPDNRPVVSAALQNIVRKCLAPAAADRYQSAADLLDDLDRVQDDRPLRFASEPGPVDRVKRWTRRHRRGLGAAALVFILVSGFLLYDALASARRLTSAETQVAAALSGLPDGSADEGRLAGIERQVREQSPAVLTFLAAGRRTRLYHDTGLLLASRGRYERAIPWFEQALQRDPRLAEAHNNLAVACMRTGRFERALSSIDRALALGFHRAEALANRGAAWAALGEREKARADLDEALSLQPDLAAARTNRELLDQLPRSQSPE